MSCLMMNAKPLASLADWIAALLSQGYNGFGMEAPKSLYLALEDCRDPWTWYDNAEIYAKLYALNAAAYESRYSRHDEPVIIQPPAPYQPSAIHRPPEYKNHVVAVAPWHYHISKRLSFLVYQCNEDGTSNSELYKALVQLLHNLQGFIVQHSDEWQALPWME